jgi:hypothetical protein
MTDGGTDSDSIVIRVIFDDIDDNPRVARLETLPPTRFDHAGKIYGFLFSQHRSY